MDENKLLEKKIACEPIARGAFLTWERWQAQLPNGQPATRDIIRHPGAAAIVVIDDQKRICMVRQYRMAIDRLTWEIPAGKLDPGEAPEVCAVRELSEETGMVAQRVELLTELATTPGFCDEKIFIYLATGLSQSTAHTDEDEFLSVAFRPIADVAAEILSGQLTDSKTIAGVLIAGKKLGYL
ncbi:MAG: NUDIX hydrolase [Eubacteriales bacterium]|nr:NUDIX hydrolase [Eubacteriales bacterium]